MPKPLNTLQRLMATSGEVKQHGIWLVITSQPIPFFMH